MLDNVVWKLVAHENLYKYTTCPGNGTKYEIMAQRLPNGADFGCLGSVYDNGWLIICGLTRQAYMLQEKGELAEYYVKEKFGLYFEEDVKYVTELIRFVTGR